MMQTYLLNTVKFKLREEATARALDTVFEEAENVSTNIINWNPFMVTPITNVIKVTSNTVN